jgi:hypothetical protein
MENLLQCKDDEQRVNIDLLKNKDADLAEVFLCVCFCCICFVVYLQMQHRIHEMEMSVDVGQERLQSLNKENNELAHLMKQTKADARKLLAYQERVNALIASTVEKYKEVLFVKHFPFFKHVFVTGTAHFESVGENVI